MVEISLLRTGGKGESQCGFHLLGDAVERRRFVDPLTRSVIRIGRDASSSAIWDLSQRYNLHGGAFPQRMQSYLAGLDCAGEYLGLVGGSAGA